MLLLCYYDADSLECTEKRVLYIPKEEVNGTVKEILSSIECQYFITNLNDYYELHNSIGRWIEKYEILSVRASKTITLKKNNSNGNNDMIFVTVNTIKA